MKALLLHCRNYHIRIDELATRPDNINPEPVNDQEQKQQNCVVVLVTVEQGDNSEKAQALAGEAGKMADNVGCQKVVVLPFAHLSNNLADSETGIACINEIYNQLAAKFETMRGHFGSHKEFLLDVFGHPGNARYREY